jgi:hypothetical protein
MTRAFRESAPAADRQSRMAEAIRRVVTRREQAPRSPRMERVLKRLIWRYSQELCEETQPGGCDERTG